jgi:Do/DeqQ family serine protease
MNMRPRSSWLVPLAALVALVVEPAPGRAGDPFLRHTAAVEAAKRVGPAVVNITTEQVVAQQAPGSFFFRGDPVFERFFRDFFDPGTPRTVQSLGSGVLIDADAHVLTNEHVVARASRVRASLADGREFDATVVGADPDNDLAVLHLETRDSLPWVKPGTSGDLMVGEPVIAIGNPFGLANTVTTGVVSALQRSVRTGDRVFYGFIQTDASINPGNSGGPLLNAEGELVGINTAIYQGAQGIGFAIPIDVARAVVEELIAHGQVAPVWVGLQLQDLDPQLHEALELPRGTQGALVSSVDRHSPAERAGVRRGDLVTRCSGTPVESARDFYRILERATPGQTVALDLLRKPDRVRVEVRAEEIPDAAIDQLGARLLGLDLEPLTSGGYRVRGVHSRSGAEQVGFEAGDLVLGINGRALVDQQALRSAFLDLRGRSRALLVVQRGGGRYHVTVPLS